MAQPARRTLSSRALVGEEEERCGGCRKLTARVYKNPYKEDLSNVDDLERLRLLRTNPERYATTGLDWGNPAHYEAMANGLLQSLMGVLARQQGVLGRPEGKALRLQQARVEQRLLVVERLLWRKGVRGPRAVFDEEVIYSLEKMADAFEGGAAAWRRAKAEQGSNVLAGTMLGVGVGMAASVRANGALTRISVGPFAGLSLIAGLVTRPDVALEMEDLPALDELVQQAREIPVGQLVMPENKIALALCRSVEKLQEKLQMRDRAQWDQRDDV